MFSNIAFSIMAESRSMERMAPLHPHKISDVITFFSKKDQSQDIRDLAVVAKEIFDVEEILQPSRELTDVSDYNLTEAIKAKMASGDMWKKKLSPEKLKVLNEKKSILEKNFKPTSLEWAWVLFQQGEKTEAKKILLSNFENEYQHVMKLTMAQFGFGRTPMSGLEEAYKGLESLADEKEKASLKEKMNKAKVYVSNLPSANIMT
jgi:hypothetical protein